VKNFNLKLKIIFFLLFGIGTFLRLWQLEKYPSGFTADEAAQGYTAYSILKTGKDEWGVKFPLSPRSFGDFKPPLQTYLMIPSIALFGLNEFAIRLPNAVMGSLAIFGIFLLAKELFNDYLIGMFSAGLLAFSPWHIPLSRGAFEANLTVFFISFGAYFLLKAMKRKSKKWQILAALFLGLNMFSYHSAKLITPLIVLLFLIFSQALVKDKNSVSLSVFSARVFALVQNNIKVFVFLFSIFLITVFFSFLGGGKTRGLDIAVFNPTDNWQVVKDERWWVIQSGLPDSLGRIFHNKITYSISQLTKNYFSYFSPRFLFSEGPSGGGYGMIPGRGVLWWWALPLILLGIYQLVKHPTKEVLLVIFLILLAPIPAALTKGARTATRVAVMMPWVQIFVAWSIYQLKIKSEEWLKKKKKLFCQLRNFGALVVFLVFFSFFLEDYFVQSPRKIAKAMLYGRCPALRLIREDLDGIDKIIVSRKLSEPQAYVMFCLEYLPELVQKETSDWLRYEKENLSFLDQLGEYYLGKYIFREINWASDSRLRNTILVGLLEEFPPKTDLSTLINYPGGKPAVGIYRTSKDEI